MILAKLDKLSTREKVFLVAAIFAILAVFVDYFVVQNLAKTISASHLDIVDKSEELRASNKTLELRPMVQADYEAACAQIGIATRRSETIEKMKSEVDEIVEQSGIAVDSDHHQPPREQQGGEVFYEEYIVEIRSFEAGMQELLSFLRLIEVVEEPGMLRVSKLVLSPSKGKESVKGSMVITKVMTPAESEEE